MVVNDIPSRSCEVSLAIWDHRLPSPGTIEHTPP